MAEKCDVDVPFYMNNKRTQTTKTCQLFCSLFIFQRQQKQIICQHLSHSHLAAK